MKDKRKYWIKRAAIIAAVCSILAGTVLFTKYRTLAMFDPDEAMTYEEYSSANTIENGVLFMGTYLINITAMTDELYEKAQQSASDSNQTSIYYKSELADGAWFDVTDAETLTDIMNGAEAVPESELADLYVQYYVGADGTVTDVLEGDEINPFDIPDPYNLSKLKELEPLWMIYTGSASSEDIDQADYLKNQNSKSSGTLRTDVYTYQLLSTFFAMDLTDEDTDKCDADLARLYEAYKGYKASGQDEEAQIIYDLMEKVDASRRAIVMDKLAVAENNALGVLDDLANGKYYTVSGDFLNPDTASEQADEDGEEDDDFNDTSEDPDYIVELKESVDHEFDKGDEDEDEWWNALQKDYEKDLKTPSGNGAPFKQSSSLTDAISQSSQNCDQSYSTYQSKALEDDDSVMGHAEYEYSERVIEETSADGAGGPIVLLRDLLNIKNNVIKNVDSEMNLLDTSLLDAAEGNYEEALSMGEPQGYQAMLESGAGAAAADTMLQDAMAEVDVKRTELEFLIDAYVQREEAAKALTYVNGAIDWTNGLYGEVMDDDFSAKANGSIDTHMKYLKDLADKIKASDDSLKTKLDQLNDKKAELQGKRDAALDDNDLAGAKNYDKMIEAVDQDIAAEEKNTGKSSEDDLAENILNDALSKLADDPDADVSSAKDALAGMGDSGAADKLSDRDSAAKGGGSGSGGSGGGSQGAGGSGDGGSGAGGSGDGSDSKSGSGDGSDGSKDDGKSEDDILAAIQSMFGKGVEDMNADELAIVTAAVSRFGRTGNTEASELARGWAELMRSKDSKYLYNQYEANTPRYISMKTIGECSAYRYFYDDTRRLATLTKGSNAYIFKAGQDSVTRAGQQEKLKYETVIQKYPYLSEEDASDLFDCHAEYVTNSGYAVCLTGPMEGKAKELLDTLTGDS